MSFLLDRAACGSNINPDDQIHMHVYIVIDFTGWRILDKCASDFKGVHGMQLQMAGEHACLQVQLCVAVVDRLVRSTALPILLLLIQLPLSKHR